MYESDDLRAYRRARGNFSLKTYGILFLWLILALIQWIVVVLIEDARWIFEDLYYICLVTFALAVLIFALFIFVEKLRFVNGLNFIIALIIVELQIISTFALIVLSWWAEVLTFFAIGVILIFLFLIIGIILPRKMDLTLDIAVLFIIAFVFLIVATFILTIELTVWYTMPYSYLVVEIAISLTILLFVMYHGQTIHGNRFAEMRLNDFFLGSLILFHDFLIIFWLTFYWQVNHRPITSDSWIETSTPYPYFANGSGIRVADRADFNKDWEATVLRGKPTQKPWDEGDDKWKDTDGDGPYGTEDNSTGYPQTPGYRGWDANRGYDGRDQDRTDRGRPTQRASPKWSFYQGRKKGSEDTDDRPVNRIQEPSKWDLEEGHKGVLYKARPFDDRNLPEPEDESGDRFNDPQYRRKPDDGSGSGYGDAKGKPEAGHDNPSIDFPLAEHQPILDPASKESGYPPKSMVEMVEMSPPLEKHPEIDVPLGKINEFADQLSEQDKIVKEDKAEALEPSLLADEMKGLKVPERAKPKIVEGLSPDWEVLSQDELKKLSDAQILKSEVKHRINPLAEPLITANPYGQARLPDFEKLVMNDSSKVLQ